MLLVAGCCENCTRAHTHTCSQFVSVNVANHPHILVLPWREQPEDKQQLLSHHLALSYNHHSLFFSLSPSLSFTLPPALLSPFSLSSSAPILPQSTLSPSSRCCIDFCKASPVISPYLLIPTLTPSLSTSQGCFHFHAEAHINNLSFSLSAAFSQAHAVFPFQIWLLLISFSALPSISSKMHCISTSLMCLTHF